MSDSPLPAPLATLSAPAAWLYGAVVQARNRRWDAGKGVVRLPAPVISIGNLVAGGTGKSPVVCWLASRLSDEGVHPVIAMRGYAAEAGSVGDEAAEYRARLPSVPVLVGADRFAEVSAYLDRGGGADCVLLDDGFQHRRLARDLDVVLVDASRPCLDSALLPRGWLREPAEALRRADAVVVTRADAIDASLARRIEPLHGRPPLAWCRHVWTGVRVHEGDSTRDEPTSWLRDRAFVGLFGVGHPESVRVQLARLGGRLVGEIPARDHARLDVGSARDLRDRVRTASADAALVTGKDWAKLGAHRTELPRTAVPILAIEFLEGEDALLTRVRDTIGRRAARQAAVTPAIR